MCCVVAVEVDTVVVVVLEVVVVERAIVAGSRSLCWQLLQLSDREVAYFAVFGVAASTQSRSLVHDSPRNAAIDRVE